MLILGAVTYGIADVRQPAWDLHEHVVNVLFVDRMVDRLQDMAESVPSPAPPPSVPTG